jgi:hypothetical protein
MPTNFPTSVDNFTNPTANDSLNLPSHSTQHANANDAIEAVEDYLLNGAGRSGLVLIKTQTVGTTVASVTVNDVFSASYDEYKIIYSGGITSSSVPYIYMTIGAINSGYFTSGVYQTAISATQVTFNGSNAGVIFTGLGATNGYKLEIEVSNPFAAKFKHFNTRFAGYDSISSSGGNAWATTVTTTSCTSFALAPATGTMTGGIIYVYGYRK